MKHYIIKPCDYFTKRNLPKNFVDRCAHSGSCDKDVKEVMPRFSLSDVEYSREYLKRSGIDETESMAGDSILGRVLWRIAWGIKDTGYFYFGE